MEAEGCLVLHPSKEEFSRPFVEYVSEVFAKHPGVACFKVIPPKGYSPRQGDLPKFQDVKINTPIKQYVLGSNGIFKCVHMEQKEMTVAEFRDQAKRPEKATPVRGHKKDEHLERSFWSRVSLNPPLYGADTDVSFFDKKVKFGWNMHDLGDLLKQYKVPNIPGVTTPMTYFGMWKSFFSWHVEDVDLYSVNYLHFGAPKVWYCVPPASRKQFEQMAKSIMMGEYQKCKGFLRHKEVLISPSVLKQYHVDYKLVKQNVGEFMVLNAGAYHCGFNQGFNCAEAVNFATQDWIPQGLVAVRCNCSSLPDGVRIDMATFMKGEWSPSRLLSKAKSQLLRPRKGDDGEATPTSSSAMASSLTRRPVCTRKPGRPRKEDAEERKAAMDRLAILEAVRKWQKAQQDKQQQQRSSKSSPGDSRSRGGMSPSTNRPPSTPARADSEGSQQKKRGRPRKRPLSPERSEDTLPKTKRRLSLTDFIGESASKMRGGESPIDGRTRFSRVMPSGITPLCDLDSLPKDSIWHSLAKILLKDDPSKASKEGKKLRTTDHLRSDTLYATVGEFDDGSMYFHLAQKLVLPSRRKGHVVLRLLQEDRTKDCFWPTDEVWEEPETALVDVRSQCGRDGSYRLLILRKRILDIDFLPG